ncbi:MAG: arginyltransferase, partial [Aestuariivirgaceae bacterium]
MSVERRNFPQFFITSPAPCPYIEGRIERKVFTHLINKDAQKLHDALSQGGFRRSQNIAYRPACDGCSACISVRVPVASFDWNRSFRRSVRRNRDLVDQQTVAKATSEQYSLFRSYIEVRHDDGGMADMTVLDFSSMINESFVNTQLIEYRLPRDITLAGTSAAGGELVAASLVDT